MDTQKDGVVTKADLSNLLKGLGEDVTRDINGYSRSRSPRQRSPVRRRSRTPPRNYYRRRSP